MAGGKRKSKTPETRRKSKRLRTRNKKLDIYQLEDSDNDDSVVSSNALSRLVVKKCLIAGVISDHLTLGRVLMERSSWGGQALKMQLHDKAPRRFFRWCALTCDHNWPSGSKAKKWIPEFFPIFISPGGIINFHAMNLCPNVSIAELVEWPEAFSGARFCNIWHRIRD